MAKNPKKKSDKTKGSKELSPKKAAKSGSPSRKDGGAKKAKSGPGAGDAFVNLLQSPLVADLVAVAATAAIGALAAKNASGADPKASGNAVKAAGKAAAAAIGRRLTDEVAALKKSSKGGTKE